MSVCFAMGFFIFYCFEYFYSFRRTKKDAKHRILFALICHYAIPYTLISAVMPRSSLFASSTGAM